MVLLSGLAIQEDGQGIETRSGSAEFNRVAEKVCVLRNIGFMIRYLYVLGVFVVVPNIYHSEL